VRRGTRRETTFGYRRTDPLARCPDQLECLKQLFGWRNLVRLPSETIQRNPDRPEVHHTAERFKAVPGEPVVTEKLPYDLKVVGAGEVNGPPVPIQEPFEHLSRRVGLEDVGDGGPIEIPDVPEAQHRLSENPSFARVNDLL